MASHERGDIDRRQAADRLRLAQPLLQKVVKDRQVVIDRRRAQAPLRSQILPIRTLEEPPRGHVEYWRRRRDGSQSTKVMEKSTEQ